MEYLDDLDSSALQALTELGGDISDSNTPPNTINTSSPPTKPMKRRRRIEAKYILRLEPPLSTAREVATTLGLSRLPRLEIGSGEDGDTQFCLLPQSSVVALDCWAPTHCPTHKFTKIRLNIAHKDETTLPVLGRGPTLPQHKSSGSPSGQRRSEPEYPLDYFFYGTLALPSCLSRQLEISSDELSPLEAATLLDGRIRTWAGKYRALVDDPGGKVDGWIYRLTSEDQEAKLRRYEGDSYEVVQANAVVQGKEIEVRTFRFSGFEDELMG